MWKSFGLSKAGTLSLSSTSAGNTSKRVFGIWAKTGNKNWKLQEILAKFHGNLLEKWEKNIYQIRTLKRHWFFASFQWTMKSEQNSRNFRRKFEKIKNIMENFRKFEIFKKIWNF